MNDALTLAELKQRLHPKRFTNMSPKMAFIVGAILGENWASGNRGEQSKDTKFCITSDGFVVSETIFIGSVDDFEDNLERLEQVAKLNEEQRQMFAKLRALAITDYRLPKV